MGDGGGRRGNSFGGHPALLPTELPPTPGAGWFEPRKSLGARQQQCFALRGVFFFPPLEWESVRQDANLRRGQPRLPASPAPGPQHCTPFPRAPPPFPRAHPRVHLSPGAAQQGPRCQHPHYGHWKDVNDLQVSKRNTPKRGNRCLQLLHGEQDPTTGTREQAPQGRLSSVRRAKPSLQGI